MMSALLKDWWQYLFVLLETVALVIFIYFVNKYTHKFKESKDPYTIACFIFIILTIVSKVVTRTAYLIMKNCASDDECLQIEQFANCIGQVSYYLPTGLLTIAVLINVCRWLLLINLYNKMEYSPLETSHSNSNYYPQMQGSDSKTEKAYKCFLTLLIVLAFISTPTKIVYQCAADSSVVWVIQNNIFLCLLFLMNVTCIIIYCYA